MQIRKITTVAIRAVALAMPAVSVAKNDKKAEKNETKHGIGAGGVPALRDHLQGQLDSDNERIDALEAFFEDDDLDGFTEVEDDCDDANAAVNPLAAEVPLNLIDDDCDHLIDEAA